MGRLDGSESSCPAALVETRYDEYLWRYLFKERRRSVCGRLRFEPHRSGLCLVVLTARLLRFAANLFSHTSLVQDLSTTLRIFWSSC